MFDKVWNSNTVARLRHKAAAFFTGPPPGKRHGSLDLRTELRQHDYFVDREDLLSWFSEALRARVLRKRILVLKGMSGVGKSSLLSEFRHTCSIQRVPAARASLRRSGTALDVLSNLADEFSSQGVLMASFAKGLDELREALRASRGGERRPLGEIMGSAMGGAAEGAVPGASLLGKAAGAAASAGASLLVGALAEMSDAQRSFILQPALRLTTLFAEDLRIHRERAQRDGKRDRLVVLLDDSERAGDLAPWLLRFAQRVPSNVLLVIAGHTYAHSGWEREWPDVRTVAQARTIEPLDDDDARLLVQRYVQSLVGDAAAQSVDREMDSVVEFAEGLPLFVTTVVDHLIESPSSTFVEAKRQSQDALADRILADVDPEAKREVEAAIVLRWFNEDSIQGTAGSSQFFSVITRYPYVVRDDRGYYVHDQIRKLLEERMCARSPHALGEIHLKAASVCAQLAAMAPDELAAAYLKEELYHLHAASSDLAGQRMQLLFEGLLRMRLLDRLMDLVEDLRASSGPDGRDLLDSVSALWAEYYRTLVMGLIHGPQLPALERIASSAAAPAHLRARAYADLALAHSDWDQLGTPEGIAHVRTPVAESRRHDTADRLYLDRVVAESRTHMQESAWTEAANVLSSVSTGMAEEAPAPHARARLKCALQSIHVLQGDWGAYSRSRRASIEAAEALNQTDTPSPNMLARALGYWSWGAAFSGDCAAAERETRQAIEISDAFPGLASEPVYITNLAVALAAQRRFSEAEMRFREALELIGGATTVRLEQRSTILGHYGLCLTLQAGREDQANEALRESLALKQESGDVLGLPEVLTWQGILAERQGRFSVAGALFEEAIGMANIGRTHLTHHARAGSLRVRFVMHEELDIEETLGLRKSAAAFQQHDVSGECVYLLARARAARGRHSEQDIAAALVVSFRDGLGHNRFYLDRLAHRARSMFSPEVLGLVAEYWLGRLSYPAVDGTSVLEDMTSAELACRRSEPGDGKHQSTLAETLSIKK